MRHDLVYDSVGFPGFRNPRKRTEHPHTDLVEDQQRNSTRPGAMSRSNSDLGRRRRCEVRSVRIRFRWCLFATEFPRAQSDELLAGPDVDQNRNPFISSKSNAAVPKWRRKGVQERSSITNQYGDMIQVEKVVNLGRCCCEAQKL